MINLSGDNLATVCPHCHRHTSLLDCDCCGADEGCVFCSWCGKEFEPMSMDELAAREPMPLFDGEGE